MSEVLARKFEVYFHTRDAGGKPDQMADDNEKTDDTGQDRASRRIAAVIIYILLAAAALWYFGAHREEFTRMLSLKPVHLALLVIFNLVTRVFIGARIKFLTAPFGVKVSVAEGTGLSLMQGYGNAVAIKGGTVGVAYYLYRVKNFSIDRFLAILGGGFVITTITLSVAGLGGAAYLSARGAPLGPEIPLMFVLVLAGALGMLVFPRLNIRAGRIGAVLSGALEGWNVLKSNRSNLLKLACVELCILASFAARYWVAFRAFGQPIGFVQAFLLAPPAYFSLMVNFTPVGVGVREPLLAYMSGILGHTVSGGLGAAVLDSIILVAISLVGGPIATSILVGKAPRKDAEA